MVGVVAALSTEMDDEQSLCNLSLAVDCTLSLGSALSRAAEAPAARLSRAGSPDPDLALSLSVRLESPDAARRRTVEHDRSEQDVSWGSSCLRSDSEATPEYYPPVLEPRARVGDGARKSIKPRSRVSVQSAYKDEVDTSKALFGVIEDHSYSSRHPWLPNYLPSSAAVDAKASSRADQCMPESDGSVRVCAHCGTSKTPLWRNGPGGPKSLCNACGIRFKKAGRRSAANGGAELQVSPPPPPVTKVAKRKLSDEQHYWMFPADAKPRKRSRGSAVQAPDSMLSGSCMTWQSSLLTLSPKSPLQGHFPAASPSESEEKKELLEPGCFSSDEEEGAVLLMALACSTVNA